MVEPRSPLRRVLLLVFAIAAMPVGAQQPAPPQIPSDTISAIRAARASRLDTVIEEDVSIFVPLPRCAVPGVAARISRIILTPAGIEYAPESCSEMQRIAPDAKKVTLEGLTARQALDRLVQLDSRYHWVETDGVIVLRPLEAWADASHFLHRTSTSFHLDAGNYAGALHAVQSALSGNSSSANGGELGGRTPQGSAPISVHLDRAVSAYEALNTIVRTHGALQWRVTYCLREARHEYATMWLETFDGSGLGSHRAALENGKGYDACRPRR
jgi:hypothetical protein